MSKVKKEASPCKHRKRAVYPIEYAGQPAFLGIGHGDLVRVDGWCAECGALRVDYAIVGKGRKRSWWPIWSRVTE